MAVGAESASWSRRRVADVGARRSRSERGVSDGTSGGSSGRWRAMMAWHRGGVATQQCSIAARRGDDGEGAVRAGGAASGVRGVRTRAGVDGKSQQGSSAAAAGQRARRCSGAASSVLECSATRAQGGGKGEREGREKERDQRFDSFQTQNFHLKLEKV